MERQEDVDQAAHEASQTHRAGDPHGNDAVQEGVITMIRLCPSLQAALSAADFLASRDVEPTPTALAMWMRTSVAVTSSWRRQLIDLRLWRHGAMSSEVAIEPTADLRESRYQAALSKRMAGRSAHSPRESTEAKAAREMVEADRPSRADMVGPPTLSEAVSGYIREFKAMKRRWVPYTQPVEAEDISVSGRSEK